MIRPTVPKSPVGPKKDRLDEIVEALVVYMELARATRAELGRSNRLLPAVDFRLWVEINFCVTILRDIVKISPATIMDLQQRVVANEKFLEEVKKFCAEIAPEKPRIVTPDQFLREQAVAKSRDRMINLRKGG